MLRFIVYCIAMILAYLHLFSSSAAIAAQDSLPNQSPVTYISKILHHDGIARTYHIYLPPDFSQYEPAPLVFALHGGGGTGRRLNQSITQGTLTAAAAKRGIVLVFPEGINRQWQDGRTGMLKANKSHDDVGFVSRIIDYMVHNYGIDPRRVYATGISNGGFMSVRLALDLSEKIAAIAPVTAQMSIAHDGRTPKMPISIMIVNGTDDPLVPYEGGHVRLFKFGRSRGEILSTADTIAYFRRHNDCGQTPEKRKLPDSDPQDKTRVVIETYAPGRQQTEVILVKVIGGGHTWPGGRQYLPPWLVGAVCRDINASDMILDFFLRHSRMFNQQ